MKWIAQYLMTVFYREKYKTGWGEAATKAEKFVVNNIETVEKTKQESAFREMANRATILIQRTRR